MSELPAKTTSLTEYLLLPYDGQRTEFVNGQIVRIDIASWLHVEIIATLQNLIDIHIENTHAGLEIYSRVGVEVPYTGRDNNIRNPDLLVCRPAQWQALHHLTKAIFLKDNPPALVIEVVRPDDTTCDIVDKRLEYALAKVSEYWIINPADGYVLVLKLDTDTGNYIEIGKYRGAERINSALFSGLEVIAQSLLAPE